MAQDDQKTKKDFAIYQVLACLGLCGVGFITWVLY
jgi:hypothetical protein